MPLRGRFALRLASLGAALLALPIGCGTDAPPEEQQAPPTWPRVPSDLTAVERRVIDEVVHPETLDHDVIVVGAPEAITAGTEITAGAYAGAPALDPLAEQSRLYVIDDAPDELSGHALRYVLVGENSGDLAVYPAAAWPRAGGVLLLPTSTSELITDAHLVYATNTEPFVSLPAIERPTDTAAQRSHVPCASGRAPRRFGVVAVGSGAFSDRMASGAVAVWKKLAAADFSLSGAWGDVDTGAAKKFLDGLAALETKVECCDEVLVYIVSHGMRYVSRKDASGRTVLVPCTEGGRLSGPGNWTPATCGAGESFRYGLEIGKQTVWENDLAAALKKLNACHVNVFIEACYSGGVASALSSLPGVEHAFSTAQDDEESTGGGPGDTMTPATGYLLRRWPSPTQSDFGTAFAGAVEAAQSDNPFVNNKGGVLGYWYQAANGKTDRPYSYARQGPCPCCGDQKKDPDEACDPTAPPPATCAAGEVCSARCTCDADPCKTPLDRSVPTESGPGQSCGTTLTHGELSLTADAGSAWLLGATLGASFTGTQYGQFVRLGLSDGGRVFAGAIGSVSGATQYSAFHLDAAGSKLADFAVTGSESIAGADRTWQLSVTGLPGDLLAGVTSASVEVTDGNCAGSADVTLPAGPCPW